MKKVSIMLLAALAVLFAFTACPAEPDPEPATQDEIDNLAAFIAFFGHDRVLVDLDALVDTAETDPATLKLTKDPEVTETSVVFTLKATDYDYDGKATTSPTLFPRLASGEYTLTLTGTTSEDGKTFTAESYKFDSANGIKFEMAADADKFFDDYTSVTAVLTGVKGDFVDDAAADTAKKEGLKLTVADGKVTGVVEPKTGAEFGMPGEGTITINDHAVSLTALATAVEDFTKTALEAFEAAQGGDQ